jgi:hypothetical protein
MNTGAAGIPLGDDSALGLIDIVQQPVGLALTCCAGAYAARAKVAPFVGGA